MRDGGEASAASCSERASERVARNASRNRVQLNPDSSRFFLSFSFRVCNSDSDSLIRMPDAESQTIPSLPAILLSSPHALLSPRFSLRSSFPLCLRCTMRTASPLAPSSLLSLLPPSRCSRAAAAAAAASAAAAVLPAAPLAIRLQSSCKLHVLPDG